MWKIYHICCAWLHMHFFDNAPKSNSFNFSLFPVRNLITCFFRNAPLFMLDFLKCPIFEPILVRMFQMIRKWGLSKNRAEESAVIKKKHVIRFWKGKREKLKLFDFWAFQKKMHMTPRGKYVLHILFGAFQVTSVPRVSARLKIG